MGQPSAGDGTAVAGLGTDEVALSEHVPGDALHTLEGSGLEVPRGQDPQLVCHLRHVGGAVVVQSRALSDRFGDLGAHLAAQRAHALRFGQGDLPGAAHHHRLEPLAPHHRTDPRARGGAMLVVEDGGDRGQQLAGWADTRHFGLGVGLLQEGGLGLGYGLPPEVLGRADLGLAVSYPQIDRALGCSLQDHQVEAGPLQLSREHAAGVGAGERPGQGRLGHHHVAVPGRCRRRGEWTGGQDEPVLRRKWVRTRVHLVVEEPYRQPAAADEVLRHIGRYVFGTDRPVGEVDA